MINIIPVNSKPLQRKFVEFQYELYKNCPQFVPPIKSDIYAMMNPKKHPFYDHSEADFFLAMDGDTVVGRVAALLNKPFNAYHKTNDAEFYLFDLIDSQEVANALLDRVVEWARARGMTKLVGPKGFGPLDGYGIQVEGHQHRQMMNMMNYNYPYYQTLVENYGFSKAVDFVSSYVDPQTIVIPEKVAKAAEIARKRGSLSIKTFRNKAN